MPGAERAQRLRGAKRQPVGISAGEGTVPSIASSRARGAAACGALAIRPKV